jgi:hypothetical protein
MNAADVGHVVPDSALIIYEICSKMSSAVGHLPIHRQGRLVRISNLRRHSAVNSNNISQRRSCVTNNGRQELKNVIQGLGPILVIDHELNHSLLEFILPFPLVTKPM